MLKETQNIFKSFMMKQCGYAETAYDSFNYYKIKNFDKIFYVQLLSDITTYDVHIVFSIYSQTYTLFHKVKVEPYILNNKKSFCFCNTC